MVMFRDFTQRNATKLGLSGEVWNNEDGTVGVITEGTKDQLQKFVARLKKGSMLSRVDSLKEEWKEAADTYKGFRISY